MIRLYLVLSIFISAIINLSASDIVAQADSAYVHDNFTEAVSLYTQVIEHEGSSSELYYNLGNAYYRLGKLGKAIVCYERAIILDPQNKDAITNLEFVNTKITDKAGDNGTFISNAFNELINNYHSNTWAIIAVISFVLLICAILVYFFSRRIGLKKIGFFSGMTLLLFNVIVNIFAYEAAHNATSHSKAVIVEPSVILSTSPREPKDRTEEAILLHEGTKVEILDSVSATNSQIKWYDVKIDNNHRAWIKSSDIEII